MEAGASLFGRMDVLSKNVFKAKTGHGLVARIPWPKTSLLTYSQVRTLMPFLPQHQATFFRPLPWTKTLALASFHRHLSQISWETLL